MNSLLTAFRSFPRNIRFLFSIQPLFSVPYALYNSYAVLYMMQLGLSSQEVGLISSLSFGVRALSALFAGWLINKMGRKWTLITFDAISWLIPYILLANAYEFKVFLIAGLIMSMSQINYIAWYCYQAEDVKPQDRVQVFTFQTMIEYICGFLPPVMGLLVMRYSLVPAMRGVYTFAAGCVVIFILLKVIFLRDTDVGIRMRRDTKGIGPGLIVSQYREVFSYLLKQKSLMLLYPIQILVTFGTSMMMVYYTPYLNQEIGLPVGLIGIVPMFTTIISMIVALFVIPRFRSRYYLLLSFVLGFMVAGGVFLLIADQILMPVMLTFNVLLWGIGNACILVVLRAEIQNRIKNNIRASAISVYEVVSMACMLPAGLTGGILYSLNPGYTVALVTIIYALSFVLYTIGKSRIVADSTTHISEQEA